MRFEKITIKDVAKALGVSTSTVSRALRDSYEIGSETKKRVLEYSQKVNFTPNQMASSLKAKASKSIGVVVSEISNSFFSQVMDGIESVANKKGYNVIVTQTNGNTEKEISNIRHLAAHSVDGILISLSPGSYDVEYIKELVGKKMPLVFFDRVADEVITHKVMCDNYQGAFDAVTHLIENGHKQIGFLGGSKHVSNIKERYAGYCEALKKANILVNEEQVKFWDHASLNKEDANKDIDNILKLPVKPTALLVCGDTLTSISLKYFKANNISIPDDIALICFTNQEFSELLNPPLSTIYQPAVEIGGYATNLLFQLINSKTELKSYETKKFPCVLNIRESSLKKIEKDLV